MKLGIMGTGMIVRDMVRMIDQLALEKVYVLATPTTVSEAEELVQNYNLTGYYTDFEKFITSDIDTTYVGLPNHIHYEFAKKSILNGKNVIIEKPVCANLKEFVELRKLAKEKGVFMFEAMPTHYLPAVISLKEDLDKVGNIKIVLFNYSQYSSRYDKFKEGVIMPAFDPKKAGGALMDINVYNINGAISLFGKPKSYQYLANIEKNIDTSGMLLMDYGNFKAVCIGAKDCKSPYVLNIQGDKACISIETPFNFTTAYQIFYNNGETERKELGKNQHRLYFEFAEFMRIIKEKDLATYEKMLDMSETVMEIIENARKSVGIVFDND